MKNIKNILLVVMLLLSVGTACNHDEFFELERPPQFPWNNQSELEMAVREVYRNMYGNGWANPIGQLNLYMYPASDIAQLLPGTSGNNFWYEYYNRLHQETVTAGGIEDVFKGCYLTITAANAPLEYIKELEETDGFSALGISQEDYNKNITRIKGELYFMRGMAYYYLVRFFTPPYDPNGANDTKLLTLKTDFSTNADDYRSTTLGTTQDIYEQIESDWKKAKELLPEEYSGVHDPSYQEARATKYAASGMLQRLYFLMGAHDKAKSECDFIISSGKFSMDVDPIEAYNRNTGQGTSPEVIFEWDGNREAGIEDRIVTTINKSHYAAMNGGRGEDWSRCGWNQFTLSYATLKEIGWMADPMNGDYTETEEAKKDKRYEQLWYRLEGYVPQGDMDKTEWLNTYETLYTHITTPQVWCDRYYRAPDGGFSKRPMIRLAEMYLTRAIIRFNTNDKPGAMADLNIVRVRAGLDPLTDAGTLTEDMIHHERIKELGAEHGDRITYLMALRKPIPPGDRQGVADIMPPYSDFYWDIPPSEKDLNGAYDSDE